MVSIGRLTATVDADSSRFNTAILAAETRLRAFNQVAQADALRGLQARSAASAGSFTRMAAGIGGAVLALGGLVAIASRAVRVLGDLDAANVGLENRLRVVTETEAQSQFIRSRLVATSLDLRTSVESVGLVYGRLAFALSISDERLLSITDTLVRAGVAGGSSVQELNAGLVQLSQGFASNRFQGDELRSVLENLPGVTRVLLDGFIALNEAGQLNFTVRGIGDIREAAAAGLLTRDVLIDAFEAGRDTAVELGEEIQFGIVQSLQNMRTAAVEALDAVEGRTRIFGRVSDAISGLAAQYANLAENLDRLEVRDTWVIATRIFLEGPSFLTEAFETGNVITVSARLDLDSSALELDLDDLDRSLKEVVEQREVELKAAKALEEEVIDIRSSAQNRINQQRLQGISAARALELEIIDIRGAALNRINQGILDDIEKQRIAQQEADDLFFNTSIGLSELAETEMAAQSANEAERELQAQRVVRTMLWGSAINTVLDAAITGTENWGAVFLSVLNQVIQTFAFPGRQHGGPVFGGRAYLVGEEGPELFVPQASGSIVPSGDQFGGLTFNVAAGVNEDAVRRFFYQEALPIIREQTTTDAAQRARRG